MFNLEKSIAEWRQQMTTAGIKDTTRLEELEIHLREDICFRISSGASDNEAFQLAAARMGNPGPVGAEFKKVNNTWSAPLIIGVLLWSSAVISMIIFCWKSVLNGNLDPLLFAHFFTLTAGYCAAFLAGGFGIYWAGCRTSRKLTPARKQSLQRAVFIFSNLAAGFVAVGFILGELWTKQHAGHFWINRPRAMGGLCGFSWLAAMWLVQRFYKPGNNATMVMCMASNVVVLIAWFGPIFFKMANYEAASFLYWPLQFVLGIHLLFLVMGIIPQSEKTAT